MRRFVTLSSFCGFALGCAAQPVAGTTGITTYDPVNTTVPVPTTSTSTGIPDSGEATDTEATTSTTSQHPSTSDPLPDFESEGCGKIDVLYIFEQDMPDEHWESVRAGIVYFNERLLATFANIDFHLLVTVEPLEWPGDVCVSQCEEEGYCELAGPDFPCESLQNIHPCEKKGGAGHTFPIGMGAANRRCVGTNSQYLRSKTTPDLLNTLNCTTDVGGNFEGVPYGKPSNSMMTAVIDDGPNGCNQGFLRDDAPLIVVYVARWASVDWPPEFWAQTVIDAKGGDVD
ncbi:MAG: hypothetical protein ACPG4T_12135, partial [Nannocystaceae bacterium]